MPWTPRDFLRKTELLTWLAVGLCVGGAVCAAATPKQVDSPPAQEPAQNITAPGCPADIIGGKTLALGFVQGAITALDLHVPFPTVALATPSGEPLTLLVDGDTGFQMLSARRWLHLEDLAVGQQVRVDCFTDEAGRKRAWFIERYAPPTPIVLPPVSAATHLKPIKPPRVLAGPAEAQQP